MHIMPCSCFLDLSFAPLATGHYFATFDHPSIFNKLLSIFDRILLIIFDCSVCIPILLLVIYNFIIYFTLNHDISAVQQSLHEKYSAANGEKEPREWRRDTRMTTEEKSNRFVSDGWWVYFIILIPHSQSHKWLYDCNWIRNKERHN